MEIHLCHLSKAFGETHAVQDANARVHDGEFFFLLGPSGCGKTTLLRILAGFLEPDQGDLFFGEQRMNLLPAHQRDTALVFQNYAVWPHMTVFENVAYGLRIRKRPMPEIRQRVQEVLHQVRLFDLAQRRPSQLSGGQLQRIALARAMVVRPSLLLFDEPLCNLDAKLRIQMREEIVRLRAQTGSTAIYVTHDQEEALSMADRIAVMDGGKVQQIGTPQEIYESPANRFVAQFIGALNLFESSSRLASALAPDKRSAVGFRPEQILLAPCAASSGQGDAQRACVHSRRYMGSHSDLVLRCEQGEEIRVSSSDSFAIGEWVTWQIKPGHLMTFQEP